MPEPKIYVPKANGKEHTFADGGKILKLGFHVDTLIEFVKKHVNEKGYINLIVTRRKEVGQFGETHGITLDTWKPGSGGGGGGRHTDAPADKPTAAQLALSERRKAQAEAKGETWPPPGTHDYSDSVPF